MEIQGEMWFTQVFCKCNERDLWWHMGPVHMHELVQDFETSNTVLNSLVCLQIRVNDYICAW